MAKSIRNIVNWIQKLCTQNSKSVARSRRALNPLQAELLEVRELLTTILLDIPNVDGDSGVIGATATEMKIDGFSWGLSRDASSATNPLTAPNLTFVKSADSTSPNLFANAAYGPDTTASARVRILDDVNGGREVLRLSLRTPRLTSYSTSTARAQEGEQGSLSFSNIVLTNNAYSTDNIKTTRSTSVFLPAGTMSTAAIAGSGNIDVNNQTNLETVLELAGQKLLIDGYDWSSKMDYTFDTAGVKSGDRTLSEFQVSRSLDAGTPGLLGHAVAGTVYSKISVTDRRPKLVEGNEVYLQFDLYNAFISSFNIEAGADVAPTNGLRFGYSKIEVTYLQYNSNGIATPLKSTWDSVTQTGTSATLLTDSSLVTSSDSSFLNFSGAKVRYDDLAWSVQKPVTVSDVTAQGKTSFNSMVVNLPTGPATSGLIGNLFTGKVHAAVKATELNALTPTLATDNWTLTSTLVSDISISSSQMSEPEVRLGLAFAQAKETFATTIATTTGDRVFTNEADYHRGTQSSTSTTATDFGGLTAAMVPALAGEVFVLTITENGKVSEIPVNEASWGVSRSISSPNGSADREASAPTQVDFMMETDPGIHSPGFFLASTRGDEIDTATLRRYEIVDGQRVEAYHWDLEGVYFTRYSATMLPGANAREFDSISLRAKKVTLVSNELDAAGVGQTFSQGWDFMAMKAIGTANSKVGPYAAEDERSLAAELEGVVDIKGYQWGGALSIMSPDKSGTRIPGNVNAGPLIISLAGRPSTRLLKEALEGKGIDSEVKATQTTEAGKQPLVDWELSGVLVDRFRFRDTNLSSGAAVAAGFDFTRTNATFTPVDAATGKAEPAITVTWDKAANNATGNPPFGGFLFPLNPRSAIPAMLLEINDGASRSQIPAEDYSWGLINPVDQLIGNHLVPKPLATRTITSGGDFLITTQWDRATPALIHAMGTKTMLPEIRLTERRNVPVNGILRYLPFREWILKDVYVTDFSTSPTSRNLKSPVTLAFDAGKVVSNFFTYDANGKRSTRGTSINFVTPPVAKAIPAVVDGLPAGIRKVALPSYFSDEQEDSTALRYSITGNSNVDLFDAVTIDADKNLVLDFKSRQTATALIELQAMDSFGLVRTQSLYVKADGNPISAAPAGITATISMNENTSYAFLPTDFRFIDPDVPGHQLRNVKITTLPDRGRLTLTTATGITAVTAGQFIPAAAITARQLKYRPLANEHGTSYSSFTFQVQDSGGTVLGGADLDLSPNTITFNVVHNSGSTLMALLQDLDSQLVDQFGNGLAGSPKTDNRRQRIRVHQER